jgi:hypothetical protein
MAKPLVGQQSTKINVQPQGLQMLFYRAALPLSHQTLTFVSDLIRTHRREIGSVWRALNPGQQALLVLVYLRKGEPFAEVGAGFGVSTTTKLAVCQRNRRTAGQARTQVTGGAAEGQAGRHSLRHHR